MLARVLRCTSRSRANSSLRLRTSTGKLARTLYAAGNSHSVHTGGTVSVLGRSATLSGHRRTVVDTIFTNLRNGGLSLAGIFPGGRCAPRSGGALTLCFGGTSCSRGHVTVNSSNLLRSGRYSFLSYVRQRCDTVTLGRLLKSSADISRSVYTECRRRRQG